MIKVDIHAGHGGADVGAVSGGMKEVHGNFVSSKACREYLEAYPQFACLMVRTSESQTEHLESELAQAKAWGASLFIDPHENAGGGDGAEVWVRKGDDDSILLGKLILEELGKIGQNSRGIKYNDNLRFLKATKGKVAVLPEAFFIDNPTDRKIGDTDAELKKIGYAYAKAILRYCGFTPNVYLTTTGMNIRKSKSTTSTVVGKIAKGTMVSGKTSGDWLKVANGYVKIKTNSKIYLKKV